MKDYKISFLDFFQKGEYIKSKDIFFRYLKSEENILFFKQFCDSFDSFDSFDKNQIYEVVYLYLTKHIKKEDKILFEKYCKVIQYNLKNSIYNKHKIDINRSALENLEILIPTYNRKNILLQTIKEIKYINPLIHITVVDNHSLDGTFEALKYLCNDYPNINFFQNIENIGFSRNVFQCIKKSTKKYIFLISDEDPIIVQDCIEAIEYMDKNKIDWLIPINFRIKNDDIIRDRGYSFVQAITPDKYRHVAQYSGIIYNGNFLRENLSLLEKYTYDRGSMYHYLLYSILSCIFQKGIFWPKPLVYPKNIGVRYIEKEEKDNIYFIPERWHQFRMIIRFIEELEKDFISDTEKGNLLILKNHVIGTIFSMLYTSATIEYKRYIELFEKPYKATQVSQMQSSTRSNEDQIFQLQEANDKLVQIIQDKDKDIDSKILQLNDLDYKIKKISNQFKYNIVRQRIQNHLSYKLGQAMIINSKTFLGSLIMPVILLNIALTHKQEQKNTKEKLKNNPLLSLQDCQDCKEVFRLKNHLSYKLGQALIKAHNTWYKGGYINLYFQVKKLKKEIQKKGN